MKVSVSSASVSSATMFQLRRRPRAERLSARTVPAARCGAKTHCARTATPVPALTNAIVASVNGTVLICSGRTPAGQHITSSASMISQTKSCRIRSESNPQNWRTKETHFSALQKAQNSQAVTALDKVLFRIWYLCWNLTNPGWSGAGESARTAELKRRATGSSK
jgi:hypothetical protein